MERTSTGLGILKVSPCSLANKNVKLTVKTVDGTVMHGVVIENLSTGKHHRVTTFRNVLDAYRVFKGFERRGVR